MTDHQPEFFVYCLDCAHAERNPFTGEIELVGKKETPVEHLGTAETLRDIHRAKTGHDAKIKTKYQDDVHIP